MIVKHGVDAHDYVIDDDGQGNYRYLCRCGAACPWTTAQLAKEQHAAHRDQAREASDQLAWNRGYDIALEAMTRANGTVRSTP